jgi:hypothetical protein
MIVDRMGWDLRTASSEERIYGLAGFRISPRIGLVLAAFGLPTLLAAVIALQPWFDPRLAMLDPIVAAEVHTNGLCCGVYFGAMSNLGILLWSAAASCCAFAWLVLASPRRSAERPFLGAAALLSAALCVDDFFLLHERVLPALGVAQEIVLVAYAVAGVAYLLVFRREIMDRHALVLLIALACLGASLGIDLLVKGDVAQILEDAAKFVGIAGWAFFHVLRALEAVRAAAPRDESAPADTRG